MTFSSSLMFAKSLIFPKAEKKSSARRSLWGALLCIGLSIVPLVVVLSITNGMIQGMTDRIIGLSSNNIQAYVSPKLKDTQNPQSYREYSKQFKNVNGVLEVYPEIGVTALAAGKKMRTGAQIRALDKDIFTKNKAFTDLFTIIEGDVLDFQNQEEGAGTYAVVGQKMAQMLDLHAGDTFRVITIKTTDGKQSPKLTSFKVSAIVSSGYQELDALWVFIPLEAAYKFVSLGNASFTVMIETPESYSPDLVRIQRELKKEYGKYINFYRWDQVHAAEFENFSSTKVMLVFVMMMIVLVASVNISSAIIMLVMERQKEIAILKSIGASPAGISFSFLLAGMSCAAGGIIFGLPLGIILTILSNQIINGLEKVINLFTRLFHGQKIVLMDPAYYLSEIPVEIPVKQVILIVIGVLLLSLLVSYLPARKAGKEKPLEILRKN